MGVNTYENHKKKKKRQGIFPNMIFWKNIKKIRSKVLNENMGKHCEAIVVFERFCALDYSSILFELTL